MSPESIADLLRDQMGLDIAPELGVQLEVYLRLLLNWNARTNLTAIRRPDAIVLRHFGESLQCARALPEGIRTLLDFGSGAGLPGAICALAKPQVQVTLAESQSKKAAFLAELARSLNLPMHVHAGRAEALPAAQRFDVVTLRAVDRMEQALQAACKRLLPKGWLMLMTTENEFKQLSSKLAELEWREPVKMRGSEQRILCRGRLSS